VLETKVYDLYNCIGEVKKKTLGVSWPTASHSGGCGANDRHSSIFIAPPSHYRKLNSPRRSLIAFQLPSHALRTLLSARPTYLHQQQETSVVLSGLAEEPDEISHEDEDDAR
jgi:hypothetical protein